MPDSSTSTRLTPLERRVLLEIPSLFPDGDSDDLKSIGLSGEQISYTIENLVKFGLVWFGLVSANGFNAGHPLYPYYRNVELTANGEQLRRKLARFWLWRMIDAEWRFIVSTVLALIALGMSMWNFLHPTIK